VMITPLQSRSLVDDLADHVRALLPQSDLPATAAVPHGVSEQLIDRPHEILEPLAGEPG